MEKHGYSRWSLLPHDILWVIMQRLDFVDCHCLSAVCRNYRSSCKTDHSRFLIPNDKAPWLFIRRTNENSLVELYRPSTNKTYTIDLPEICNTEYYYSKDGWLLLRRYGCADDHRLFLFNIFSMQKILLPWLEEKKVWGNKATFSTHKKYPNCVIVSSSFGVNCSIYAWKKGDTTWKKSSYGWRLGSVVYTCLTDDLFYLFNAGGEVYNFDKDLNLKRISPANNITPRTDFTSNIALSNNKLYCYEMDFLEIYEFDCSTMDWTRSDDASNSIWFVNKCGSGCSGVMIEGNLTNTESLLNNLSSKGCQIDMNNELHRINFQNEERMTTSCSGAIKIMFIDYVVEWNWINLQ